MTGRAAYLRFELLRTFRNRRFFVFSLIFPLVMFFLIAAPNRNDDDFAGSGIPAPLFYMVGLASFGAMMAVLSSGARISTERAAGWQRQLRITPLSARDYLRAKVLTGYMMAAISIVLLYVSGMILGVSLPAREWIDMTALILVGLIPFAALGILLGHSLSPDSVGPAVGGLVSLLAFLGGTWFPITGDGFFYHLARCLPSYWLNQAAHVATGGHGWGATGWAVMAVWTVVLGTLAARAFRRDTRRV